jgi:rhodanese-related sulfurtransferase
MNSVPELTVKSLSEKLLTEEPFVLLDVRELWEVELARINDDRLEVVPMTLLARQGLDALPERARSPQTEIYVLCHQGARSSQVTAWLASRGWTRVFSVAGGIDEYARQIDPGVGSY